MLPVRVDWNIVVDPDGTARITPGRHAPRRSGVLLAAAGLGCCALGAVLFTSLSRGAGGWRGLRLTLLIPLGLLLAGYGVSVAFGREEWRAGPDRLEVRQRLFGVRRARCFRGATLRLVGAAGGLGSRSQRSLTRAARAGASRPSAGESWWGLYVSDRSGTRCLASTSRGFSRKAEIERLGELLSERTGWPLVVARPRRKR